MAADQTSRRTATRGIKDLGIETEEEVRTVSSGIIDWLIDIDRSFLYIFYSNLQIYMTILKFIKNIHPPPWPRRDPRR
jgi:hypothetical protein